MTRVGMLRFTGQDTIKEKLMILILFYSIKFIGLTKLLQKSNGAGF